MTGERDFDRLAQAWLELGPDEAPDRVVAAVLQAAQTTPQARRPIRWLRLRDDKMTRLPVLATVAATIVVVVGGLLLINRHPPPRRLHRRSRRPPARQQRHSTWQSDPPAGWAASAKCQGSCRRRAPRDLTQAGAEWAPDFGALTYTVPAGWANSADFPERFRLKPAADFALDRSGSPDGLHEIELHWQYAANAQNAGARAKS
jgi:hypothetical protein